jgi:hypothetical protein
MSLSMKLLMLVRNRSIEYVNLFLQWTPLSHLILFYLILLILQLSSQLMNTCWIHNIVNPL